MWSDLVEPSVLVAIFAAGIRLATPYLFAAVGETIGQLSGVLNLGVEGTMLLSAFAAYYVTFETGNVWLGLIVAMIVGGLIGALMALACVTYKAQQGIAGIAIYLIGLGLSDLLFTKSGIGSRPINSVPKINVPVLRDIPAIGEILFEQSLITYLAFATVPIAWYVINKTTVGMSLQAVGQNPEAADSVGLPVNRIRFIAVTIGGVMSGLGGASLSVALINIFQRNMTAGIGFIAVALVYFGGWRPVAVLFGALLFSTINALQLQIQTLGINISSDFAGMLPYVMTIVVLAISGRSVVSREPAALTKPYTRGA
jgi:simple sugar transport system permease protein